MSIKTPFDSLHSNLKANFGDYCGWSLPSDYGDIMAENAALYQHSAAFDLSSFGKIAVSGGDVPALLEKIVIKDMTRRIEMLDDGQWTWAMLSGGDIVRIGKIRESAMIFTLPAARGRVFDQVAKAAGELGVKAVEQAEKTGMLGVYGPGAVDALDSIIPIGIGDMEPGEIKSISMFMMSITIIRGSWLGLDGIEILSGTGACKMAAGAIERYHKQQNITPAGMECLEIAMAEASLPLGIAAFGNGHEVLCAGCGSSRQVGLSSTDNVHTHEKLSIIADSKAVGHANFMVWSPKMGKSIGIGVVNSDWTGEGGVRLEGGAMAISAQVSELPLDKSISAGIYRN